MAAQRKASVIWDKDLLSGSGRIKFDSGALPETQVTWVTRTEQPAGKTSPEELLAASHASCYAMAFSATLGRRGTPPKKLDVTAVCTADKVADNWKVMTMELRVTGEVPGINQAQFEDAAKAAEAGCPISNALRNNVKIKVNAQLKA